MLFLSACAEGERYINNEEESIVALEEVPNSETIYQENIAETRTVENVTSELTSYSYEVEKDVFSFSTSEDKTYYVPYVKISGCSNEKLQWNINHTLWEDACWILDCAEIGGPLYDLFSGENAMQITGIYQYKHYLSVLYEGGTESRLPGKIAYAIVIDMLNGRRVLLGDLIENEDKLWTYDRKGNCNK